MKKNFSIFKINGFYKIHSSAITEDGAILGWEPFYTVDANDFSPKYLLSLILEALRLSNEVIIPYPSDWKQCSKDFDEKMGVKFSTIAKKGSGCTVAIINDKYVIQRFKSVQQRTLIGCGEPIEIDLGKEDELVEFLINSLG